ncbi:6-phosphogluconolactonase [Cohaesibacter sp. ES.047]|uniref:6-phosphogluconolactonase n=1 Tax=Cohaesibacter sp. ES.047 TaxID=1798205 RepID=UPI000BBF5D20|nr:6-phosphogluconolactonase [Cohaesibacter sp. ES.047]SNY92658.1 6-phosphogluconolactonase [Cohaesibacter sp. ES.047]
MSETRVYPDRGSLAGGLAEQVASELNKAIKKRGRATLAVPGGKTPREFLAALSEQDVEWESVSVILTDERFVPERSDRSNARVVKELLLQNKAEDANFYPYYREVERVEDALPMIAIDLEEVLPIDVCILGMGVDMHTASLFPGAENIEEAVGLWAPHVMVMYEPTLPEARLTLTAPVLERARKAHILIFGEEKKKALREAQKIGLVEDAPIRVILNRARATSIHYAD